MVVCSQISLDVDNENCHCQPRPGAFYLSFIILFESVGQAGRGE